MFRAHKIDRLLWCLFAVVVGLPAAVSAQDLSKVGSLQGFEPSGGILSNSVSTIVLRGDSVWTSPFLNLTTDGGETWLVSDADSLFDGRSRVFSMDIIGGNVAVGLGYNDAANDGVQSAGGFLFSDDGGEQFTYRLAPLDSPGDTTVQYGVNELSALDVIVPQQSPPFDIALDPIRNAVWTAGWASGIRRSNDGGRNWDRVVLPPDTLLEISPESTYDFRIEPRRGNLGNYNHLGFSVLVAGDGTIWAGTPKGVNVSSDGLAWRRIEPDGSASSMTGSWVVAMDERVTDSGSEIWMATWEALETGDAGGRSGVSVTSDNGESFRQVLAGEDFIDFAFAGDRVYVAGRTSGLFISDDDGETWSTVRDFRTATTDDRPIKVGADVVAVAANESAVWVGTDDGLLTSTDGGSTWSTFRVEVPLHPEMESEAVPDAETFAYPNPFSPADDRFVRLRYEVTSASSAEVNIYDFGMNLVRELPIEDRSAGIAESVWDGFDSRGLRMSNGTYFYSVDTGSDVVWGKILLIE